MSLSSISVIANTLRLRHTTVWPPWQWICVNVSTRCLKTLIALEEAPGNG